MWRLIGGYTIDPSPGYLRFQRHGDHMLGRIYGYKTSRSSEVQGRKADAALDSNSHGYRRSEGLSIART